MEAGEEEMGGREAHPGEKVPGWQLERGGGRGIWHHAGGTFLGGRWKVRSKEVDEGWGKRFGGGVAETGSLILTSWERLRWPWGGLSLPLGAQRDRARSLVWNRRIIWAAAQSAIGA